MKKITTYESPRSAGVLLNANELSYNLSAKIMDEICEAVRTIDFNRYPDPSQKEVLNAYAKHLGVKETQLLAGNGSDQMLGHIICYYLCHGKKLYTIAPDFSMYEYYASSYEAQTVKFSAEEDGSFRPDEFIRQGKAEGADMVMFSNPNNPTGRCISREDIRKILDAFRDIPVVVDEAYIEFSRTESILDLIGEYPNLYVTRTLSKAFGLAGIRIGFMASTEENMKKLRDAFVPYAVNSFSMKAAAVALSHSDEKDAVIEEIIQERGRVYKAAEGMKNIVFFPSEANFLYGRAGNKEKLMELMNEEGIIIRNYPDPDHFRITIGRKEENDRIIKVLQKYEEAV